MYDNSSLFQFTGNESLYIFLKSNSNLNAYECNDEANVESVYKLSQKKQQQSNEGTAILQVWLVDDDNKIIWLK